MSTDRASSKKRIPRYQPHRVITIYAKDKNAETWAWARQDAERRKVSLSDVVAEAMAVYRAAHERLRSALAHERRHNE